MPDFAINGISQNNGSFDNYDIDRTSKDKDQQVLEPPVIAKHEQPQSKDPVSPKGEKKLEERQQQQVKELQQIDQKVRAHEAAHMAAGGGLIRGGVSFKFETGPDGKQYAVGGEVKLDMSVDPDKPEESIQKLEKVKQAALAPIDPSPQDRSVAANASSMISQLRSIESSNNKNSSKSTKFNSDVVQKQIFAYHQNENYKVAVSSTALDKLDVNYS